MIRGAIKLLAGAALLLTSTSCVQLAWERHELNTKVEQGQEEALVKGVATLGDCLEELGAPLLAWELSETRYAIAYGWDHQREYGISVSIPVADSGGSASFDYDDVASKLHGVVFLFDEHDVLQGKRRGFLRDLAPDDKRTRPVYMDDAEGE